MRQYLCSQATRTFREVRESWLPLASIILQPSQPILSILNLRNTWVSVFPEVNALWLWLNYLFFPLFSLILPSARDYSVQYMRIQTLPDLVSSLFIQNILPVSNKSYSVGYRKSPSLCMSGASYSLKQSSEYLCAALVSELQRVFLCV